MIALGQPSMVCNDFAMRRDGITRFQMWNSWEVPERTTRAQIIGHIRHVIDSLPGRKLRHLVINCHGQAGQMHLGGWIIRHDSVREFKALHGRIGRIWLVSCEVGSSRYPDAREQNLATRAHNIVGNARNAGLSPVDYLVQRAFNGSYLCRAMAHATGAYVTAGLTNQSGDDRAFLPFGMIDRFDGTEVTWGPDGVLHTIAHNAIAGDDPQ